MDSGKFIVFEGIDGSGKTTQMNLLARALEARGMAVVCTREPGGTRVGGLLRRLLLDPGCHDLDYRAEAFLYAADRAQHVHEKILPALQGNKVVLCDRFVFSTLAYQGWGRGLDLGFLASLNDLATGGLMPDTVILLDLPVEDSRDRLLGQREPDRLECEKLAFYHRVRRGYLEQAAAKPEIFQVVQADAPVERIHSLIARFVFDLLSLD